MRVLESPGNVLDIFVSKRVGTLLVALTQCLPYVVFAVLYVELRSDVSILLTAGAAETD